jgi:hypothetical protein
MLQIQEKEILEEIKTMTRELSEEAKEIFEKEGLMMNGNGVYQMREKIFVPPKAKRTIIHEGGHPGSKYNSSLYVKKTLVAENTTRRC